MTKRSPKPQALNARAAAIANEGTRDELATEAEKAARAVPGGRLRGARARRLSASRRSEIARQPVKARWNSAEDKQDG